MSQAGGTGPFDLKEETILRSVPHDTTILRTFNNGGWALWRQDHIRESYIFLNEATKRLLLKKLLAELLGEDLK